METPTYRQNQGNDQDSAGVGPACPGEAKAREASPLVDYSPFDHATQEDPYPIYAQLREEAPLYHNAELDFYALSRHADVSAAFRDHERYSSGYGVTLELWDANASQLQGLLAMDPPEHTHLRKVVNAGFTPRRVGALEPMIRALTKRLLHEPLEAGRFDLATWTTQIPARVVAQLMGVPEEDQELLLRLAEAMVNRPDGETEAPPEFWEAAGQAVDYLGTLLAERRSCPREDLASVLAHGRAQGKELTQDEQAAILGVIGTAGNESSSKVMTNALVQAARHPDQRAKVWAGHSPVEWVEETVRYDSAAQLVTRRVTRDIELYGQVVPEGSRMALLVACANRDRRAFPEGERYDIGRDTSAAIAFGAGRHFCLGASLARLMIRVVLEEFVAAVADYELHLDTAVHAHSPSVKGYRNLEVSVKPR